MKSQKTTASQTSKMAANRQMSRNSRRGGATSHQAARAARSSWASCKTYTLIAIDASKKRRTEYSLYKRRCRELDKTTENLKTFENKDLPFFTQWVESEFADEIKQCREGSDVVTELNQLSEMVQRLAQKERITLRAAYAKIKAAKEAGTLTDLWADDEIEAYEDEDEDEDEFDAFTKAFVDFFDIFSGDSTRSKAREDTRAGSHAWQPSSKMHVPDRGSGSPSTDRLKSVYRQLVRILHPDTNNSLTNDQKNLWHEVHEAYSWRDIQRLERLLQIATGGTATVLDFGAIPISHIMDLRRDVEERLRALKSKVTLARKEIAWNFNVIKSNKKSLASLRRQLAADLADDLEQIRFIRHGLERQIASWEKVPGARKNQRKKSRASGRRQEKETFPTWLFE